MSSAYQEVERPEDLEPELPAALAFLLRHGFAAETLRDAARLAARWDVHPDQALLAAGLAGPDELYRALAAETGLPFLDERYEVHARARYPEAALSGLVPLAPNADGRAFAFAPSGAAFADLLSRRDRISSGLALTTPRALRSQLFASRGEEIARAAAETLARTRPDESFRDGATLVQLFAGLSAAVAVAICAAAWPGPTWVALTALVGLPFLGLTAIKIAASLERIPVRPARPPPRIPDRDLPVYSVLVPLFREARVLPKLLGALRALDYPAAKLEVMIVLEEDDTETPAALAELDLPGFVEVIVAPRGEPRTKPRALNVALPLARGAFVVVYDAEDVPDPDQLRHAVSVFERSEPDVVCLQARLVIDNTGDGWLPAFFTVDYGALFDVVNPALARFDLPVPLGGTSNHLRTGVLRALGGWDAWNVTEDADLALRLASAGFRVADLPSATLEEAPRELGAWLAQRTRWMKGFVQVSITHSRRPIRNLGRLGLMRTLGAAAVTFGVVASALVYPFFTAIVLAGLVTGQMFEVRTLPEIVSSAIGLTLLAGGALAMTLPGLVAVKRRGWSTLWPHALLMPLYYVLVSIAAWRGLWELVFAPHRWNKTEHGLARTSRARALPPQNDKSLVGAVGLEPTTR